MHLLHDKPAGRFSPARLFRPESIAVIGAGSATGRQVLANLAAGGFKGRVAALDDPSGLASLGAAPDLAAVAVDQWPELLPALAAKGTFAAILVCDAESLPDAAGRAGVRILGPGSFGICVPSIGLNASRAHIVPPAGRIGLVSQSASLCRTVLDWAGPNGVGFSHIVGIGGRVDLGFGMVLDWLSRDPGTGAILLDIRYLRNRRAFLSAARAASRLRPVVAIRPGSTLADPSGAAERGFEAALRRAGVLCVSRLEDLLAAAEILARARPARGEAISIVTNAISPARLAADAALRAGLRLAADIVHVEPVESERLAGLAEAAGSGAHVGGVLVVHAPTGKTDRCAMAALAASRAAMRVPLLVCAMGETVGTMNRRQLAESGMAVFATPEQAVRGFLHLVQDRRNRAAARELPDSAVLAVAPDRNAVGGVLAALRRERRLAATQDEALAVLSAYGVPVVPTRAVASADDAAHAARLLGFPAVVKLRQSVRPDRRASGGLALELHDASEVVEAAARMAARLEAGEPPLLVQRQAVRWRELRIGVADDATFGPVISFGQGGTTADIVGDIATDLPPLNLALAHALIRRTRAAATLGQFRDNPPANEPAVAEALVRVSQLIVDFPEIAELELNPLIVDRDGVVAADAWLRLREPGDTGGGLAITPYPAGLAEHWVTSNGERLLFRPIRPEDADQHGAFFNRLSPQDIRYRFFTAMRELSPEQMARLTQIDYDREMAFVAVREATGETVGVARLVCEDEREGEFAVIVQADMKGKGVARHLMQRLIEWARARGLSEIVGQVLADNAPMLAFVRHLGFRVQRGPEEPDVVEARLGLEQS
ncbi:MAG TPA: GNAT family N-acetyltransferase [Acetobacteraceae bacterium]|jgi:acetyltransferase